MKNYKILENRPELTNEQIMQGMEFNTIKSNVALAKAALLKSLVIKGLLGVVVISSIVFIYKNYRPSVTEKTQAVLVDTTKNIIPPVTDTAIIIETSIDIEANIDKKELAVVEHKKSAPTNTVAILPLPTDTNDFDFDVVDEGRVNAFKSYIHPNDEETQNSLTAAFGEVDIKEINKSLAKINGRLYASKYEVSNKLYMTFLTSLKQSENAKLLSVAQIDTLKWTDSLSYNPPYARYYHAHPAYHDYPVVNVSYEGARLFCEWLTMQYNSDPQRKFKKVLFRLPSEEEWMIAAQGGDTSATFGWGGKEVRSKKGQVQCNFKREEGDTQGLQENSDVTAPVKSWLKNRFDIYNMSGNVAEMIDEKGIAKGGSWNHDSGYLKIDAIYKYDGKAQPFVGFRYFAEIIEE